ncbi:hypothetical protein MFFC18_14950 [Mariniblastus fucicola]|uniref:Uncharacterized protein n=1 Tax=Mariniblastus fucicola TaxID=980251 RepID=A0A5B9P4V9_9BACT|nr:hypothetical protein MFFC18_14950 [Mariniblastus fucicola]
MRWMDLWVFRTAGVVGPRMTRTVRELKCNDRLEAWPTKDVHESHESARTKIGATDGH